MSTSYDYIAAYEFSSDHKAQLINDKICGCFYCFTIFNPQEIIQWLNQGPGTALCPYCCIDSIIGESSGYPITEDFLKSMNAYWFNSPTQK